MSRKKTRRNSGDFRGFRERVISITNKKELLKIQSYLSTFNEDFLWCDTCNSYHPKDITISENSSVD